MSFYCNAYYPLNLYCSFLHVYLFICLFVCLFVCLQDPLFVLRTMYDLTFFIIVIVIIIQNLIFGVIIDTFAALRAEKNKREEVLKNTCFICGELGRVGLT